MKRNTQFSYFRVGRPHSVRRRSGGKSTEIDAGLPVIRIFYGELERRRVGVEWSVGHFELGKQCLYVIGKFTPLYVMSDPYFDNSTVQVFQWTHMVACAGVLSKRISDDKAYGVLLHDVHTTGSPLYLVQPQCVQVSPSFRPSSQVASTSTSQQEPVYRSF